ncbi:hypothetical protein F2981_06290 [Sinorhizobium meliloti]|nr:hypothetical protein [Sinorhizobium meliloti]
MGDKRIIAEPVEVPSSIDGTDGGIVSALTKRLFYGPGNGLAVQHQAVASIHYPQGFLEIQPICFPNLRANGDPTQDRLTHPGLMLMAANRGISRMHQSQESLVASPRNQNYLRSLRAPSWGFLAFLAHLSKSFALSLLCDLSWMRTVLRAKHQ